MAEPSPDRPVLDLLMKMTADSLEATDLDDRTLMLVRIAALIASDAPPASYLMNVGAAADSGVDLDQVQDVLAAVAPIVGTSRVVAAVGNIARALGIALDLAEYADDAD
jgi:4-carboxymuconolactone decarboxylase